MAMRAQTSREYCICIEDPYPRRFLGRVGRTPLSQSLTWRRFQMPPRKGVKNLLFSTDAYQCVVTKRKSDPTMVRHLYSNNRTGQFLFQEDHNYKTVSDISTIPNASSLQIVRARIAIAVGILWCYVYDARPITNSSRL